MPSVRDILKGGPPSQDNALEEGLDLGNGVGQEGQDQADLIAARLRETADQRAAMAQTEINKLQIHIEQLQQRMDELTKMKMPTGKLPVDLEDAMQRLDDANADLARANESKLNTELASSLRQEHQGPSAHVDHTTHNSHGVGGSGGAPKVGAVLGRSGAAPTKTAIKGPRLK
jgi:hypothetical protein